MFNINGCHGSHGSHGSHGNPESGSYIEMFVCVPGDTVEFSVTVEVDKNSASALNSGEDTLDDILVFHLDNGKDYYISFYHNVGNMSSTYSYMASVSETQTKYSASASHIRHRLFSVFLERTSMMNLSSIYMHVK